MAEYRRFQFDAATRSVGVPAARRRVTWLWVGASLAVHAAIALFVLAGAARGGHTELLGTIEATLVGPPSAGDPDSASSETADGPPPDAAPPPDAPPPRSAVALPAPSRAAVQPAQPKPPPQPREQAAIPLAPSDPPSLHGMAKPEAATAPADPKASPAEVMRPPAKPPKPDIVEAPVAAKDAPGAKATPSAKPAPAAATAAVKQGVKRATAGQTASLGAPTGGERLGRSENDDSDGLLDINLNPRFRRPPAPPHYPRQSIERDEEGVVLVRAFVDAAGAPQRVIVFRSSGFALLDDAALKAVQGWRFEPMVRDGRAAASWVQVPVRFRLN